MTDPRNTAWHVVDEMLIEGEKKHRRQSWLDEPEDNHLDKAIRHVMTYKLIRDGNQPPDGEMHLKNALCRLAMAMAQAEDRGEA